MKKPEVEKQIAKIKWRHQIDLGNKIITPGSADTKKTLKTLQLPKNLKGKTVLDIGCSDGFFSFECEKRGAKKVVALDDYSSLLVSKSQGLKTAKRILHSKVKLVEKDFYKATTEELGQFDIVLFLGVLYHLRYPMLAIDKLASFCKEMVLVEGLISPGLADYMPFPNIAKYFSNLGTKRTEVSKLSKFWPYRALRSRISALTSPKMSFIQHDQINYDTSIYWLPTSTCLVEMLEAAGFCNVEVIHNKGSRVVVKAYHHRFGKDVKNIISQYTAENIQKYLKEVLKIKNEKQNLLAIINSLRIDQFAALRQFLWDQEATKHH